jgi:hypothetical protein
VRRPAYKSLPGFGEGVPGAFTVYTTLETQKAPPERGNEEKKVFIGGF